MPCFYFLFWRDVSRGFGVISCSAVSRCRVNNADNVGNSGKWFFYSSMVSKQDWMMNVSTCLNVDVQMTVKMGLEGICVRVYIFINDVSVYQIVHLSII